MKHYVGFFRYFTFMFGFFGLKYLNKQQIQEKLNLKMKTKEEKDEDVATNSGEEMKNKIKENENENSIAGGILFK